MPSFKHFRIHDEKGPEDFLAAQSRMISLLLDGTVIHAVRGDPADYTRFESDLAAIREEIATQHLNPGDLLIKTGYALKALQDYNRRTSNFRNAQSIELQKITSMLTGAIANLSVAGSTNVTQLQAIERQLEKTAGLDDVRLLKERLSECLLAIREEKLRQQAASEAAISDLSENLHSVRAAPSAPSSLDAATGPQSRPAAEMAIAAAADGVATVYGALFVIDHLHRLNIRFGRAVGDQIIALFTQHLAQHLHPKDVVFRWSGPAFLVLLERDEPIERVRRSLAPIAGARLEKTVESRDRTVLLPLNFSWTLLPIPVDGKASGSIDRFDAFLSSKLGADL